MAKILTVVASIAFTTALVWLVVQAFPTGESETRALLVVALVVAYPFQTLWLLSKLKA